ncbi:MAG: glycosyltransferase family 4 protein [Candidatus Kuenenbacteria bacterium]
MKICVINSLYSPYHRGGAEVVAENQVKNFIKQGNDVFVITTRPICRSESANCAFSFEDGIKIYRFYPLNIFSVYFIYKHSYWKRIIWRIIDVFNIHSYKQIKKILAQEKPDIVYVHNLTGIGYLIPRLIKKLNIKYIQIMHDIALVYPIGFLIKGEENSFKNRFLGRKIYEKISKYLFGSPGQVCFPSEWLKKFYDKHGFFTDSERIVKRNYDISTENLLRDKRLLNPPIVNFIYIGQIEKHKGILFLIKIINELRAVSCELLIIGNGAKLQEVKEATKNNPKIKFFPWKSEDKVRQLLKESDYTIVPSLCYENAPTTIFESLKAGVPVIASNLGGIPEIIKNGVNGYLFEAGNEESLLAIMQKLTK